MIRKALLASAALALLSSAASAASQAVISKDYMTTMLPHGIQSPLPPELRSGGILDNFASKYKDGLYFCCEGGTITGPSFVGGYSYEQAVPFTPTATKSVTTITIGLGYVSGTNSATVALYSDNGGVPGTELASGTASSMPDFGSCCTTAKVKISSTSVTKGTQYWVVVSATGNTWTAWNYSTTDQVDEHTYAYNYDGEGWNTTEYILYPTVDVK
jgi:hypothetical protein